MTTGAPAADDAARPAALFAAMVRRSAWRLATSWQRVEGGWSARTGTLPSVWTLNSMHLDERLPAAQIEALVERYQDDLTYRHVLVDGAVDEAVEAELRDTGWTVERDCVMALGTSPPLDLGLSAVTELSEDELLALMAAWLVEEQPTIDAGRIDQVLEFCRLEGRLWSERRLGVRGPTGAALGVARLRCRDHVAWIEDVYVAAAARGKGHGRAIVAEAARAAVASGCAVVVLAADADDWPRHLYAALGFGEVGSRRIFHLEADGTAASSRGPGSWA